jgi:hypothetical protein
MGTIPTIALRATIARSVWLGEQYGNKAAAATGQRQME